MTTPPSFLEAPFFTQPSGAIWTTEFSRRLFKRVATSAGIDPDSVGGKASRIGGSTDAKERTGEAGKAIIKRGVDGPATSLRFISASCSAFS